MKNLNPEEKEKIRTEIIHIKEEIYETKVYLNSDICKKCSDMYQVLFRLEQHLKGLEYKLSES